MKTRILLVVAAGLLVGADKPKSDDTKKALKQLQGTWSVVGGEENGEKITKEGLQMVPRKVVIKGNKYTVDLPDGTSHGGTFTINVAKKPHTLDGSGDDGQKVQAIFAVKGDTLRICFDPTGGDRPTGFATKGKNTWIMLIMKRAGDKK